METSESGINVKVNIYFLPFDAFTYEESWPEIAQREREEKSFVIPAPVPAPSLTLWDNPESIF